MPPPDCHVRQLLLRLAGVTRIGQNRSSAVLAHQELVCDPRHPLHIKSEGAESAENFIEAQEVYFCSHGCDRLWIASIFGGSYTKDCYTLLSHIDAGAAT